MVLDAGCKSQWVPMSLMGLGIVQQIMQARLAEGRELVRAADIPRFHGHDGTMMWSQFAS